MIVKLTFRVADMHCVNCAMRLQDLEDGLPGVISVDTSYLSQKMVVKFENSKTNADQIIQVVHEMGYTAELEMV